MSATVKGKGFLKRLRYLAHIFGLADPKEQEIQIGFPTDVKHAAHIGWDGSSANAPSWMELFKPVPELAHQTQNSVKELKKNPTKDLALEGSQDTQPPKSTEKPKNRSRRKCRNGGEVPLDSLRGSDGRKQSKRRHSVDSPRNSNLSTIECQDFAGVSKRPRRKKLKGSEGTSKASKSRGQNPSGGAFHDAESKTDAGQGMENKERKLSSVQ